MKIFTAITLTFMLLVQSFIMPVFIQWYKKEYNFTSDNLFGLWFILAFYSIGYCVLTIGAWHRALNNTDKWFD